VRDITGYEIHVGVTHMQDDAPAFARLRRQESEGQDILDGAQSSDGRIVGTYLHGLFDDDAWRHAFVGAARAACGLAPAADVAFVARERDGRFERIAAVVEQSCDIDAMIAWLT
jgi:adenosylcobyric acid synthase